MYSGYLYMEFTTGQPSNNHKAAIVILDQCVYMLLCIYRGEGEKKGKIIEQIKTLTKEKKRLWEKIAVNNFYNHNHDLSRNFSISSTHKLSTEPELDSLIVSFLHISLAAIASARSFLFMDFLASSEKCFFGFRVVWAYFSMIISITTTPRVTILSHDIQRLTV